MKSGRASVTRGGEREEAVGAAGPFCMSERERERRSKLQVDSGVVTRQDTSQARSGGE